MNKMPSVRTERGLRLTETRGGVWGSSSQDYLRLANDLYSLSRSYAKSHDGNVSIYTLAGIPILVTTIRALLIEANSGMYGSTRHEEILARLAKDQNEVQLVQEKYLASGSLAEDFKFLHEVRNEIVHPAHTPAGTMHNTPKYMQPLRVRGLLQSKGDNLPDYNWLDQLQSHRLFNWAFTVIEPIAEAVLKKHQPNYEMRELQLKCYSQYLELDL